MLPSSVGWLFDDGSRLVPPPLTCARSFDPRTTGREDGRSRCRAVAACGCTTWWCPSRTGAAASPAVLQPLDLLAQTPDGCVLFVVLISGSPMRRTSVFGVVEAVGLVQGGVEPA